MAASFDVCAVLCLVVFSYQAAGELSKKMQAFMGFAEFDRGFAKKLTDLFVEYIIEDHNTLNPQDLPRSILLEMTLQHGEIANLYRAARLYTEHLNEMAGLDDWALSSQDD